ncbi:MAG TPA: iron-containing alcohol dehydrogenase [Phycisphaerae bacterium]|nr:iron-containing alcohol dehydrogenase [Phycisphaerae bacterium]
MRRFTYCQPTEIRFGCGRIADLPEAALRFGRRALLVTDPGAAALAGTYEAVKHALADVSGILRRSHERAGSPGEKQRPT